ncbi:MAG: hypothetical protein ACRD4Q_14510 [Candidatus Acidiferrales bacterium]
MDEVTLPLWMVVVFLGGAVLLMAACLSQCEGAQSPLSPGL